MAPAPCGWDLNRDQHEAVGTEIARPGAARLGHAGGRVHRGLGEHARGEIVQAIGQGLRRADLLGCRKDEEPAAAEAAHLVGDSASVLEPNTTRADRIV
jgi:hypothetical protein